MRKLLFIFAASLFLAPVALAQSCVTSTCNAASVSESDVLAALPSSSNPNSTVTVNIPFGTASWTSQLNYTVPSGVSNLTIQGATSILWSGTAGMAGYSYSISDNTVISDGYATNNPLIYISINNNQSVRVTGLTVQGGSAGTSHNKYSGVIYFQGSTQSLRMDHVHLNNNTYSPSNSSSWVRVGGSIVGVFDHNVLDLGNQNSVANGFQAFQAWNDTIGLGDGTWKNPTPWGTNKFLFFENNYFNGGAPDDCADGGAFVMRYNTINSAYVGIQTHATKSPGGPFRGCRAYEAYNNYATGSSSAPSSAFAGSKGGPALLWNNTLAQGYYRFFEGATDRQSGDETETNTPNGWGYCGTSVNGNGVGSGWDGNQNTGTGYPCLDGLGRGQTQQALNGQSFPNRLNSSTSTIAWPNQDAEPIYLWGNTLAGVASSYMLIQDTSTVNNQDYFYDCGSWNSSCSSSFNGTKGTGFGPASSRPATCTAGAGGTYHTSPVGSQGVAYFNTDANTLSVCTSTNTWTTISPAYTYPHPLINGGGSGVSLTVNISGPGSVSGPNCFSNNYPSGTAIGACIPTPSGGSTFAGWTASGSTSCGGTGNCGPFNLTTNTTLTATFTATPVCANASQAGPNFSGTYFVPPTSLPLPVGFNTGTSGCLLHYTTDGSAPTSASPVLSGSLNLSATTTVRVIAVQPGYMNSGVVGGTWSIISNVPAPPTISGTISVGGTISIH